MRHDISTDVADIRFDISVPHGGLMPLARCGLAVALPCLWSGPGVNCRSHSCKIRVLVKNFFVLRMTHLLLMTKSSR
jgi:hypothetical protein